MVAPVLVPHVHGHGGRDGLPATPFRRAGDRVGRAGDVRRLALELAMAREPRRIEAAVGEGRPDVAAGLAIVAAVPELAAVGEVGDVREGVLEAVGRAGDAERADAWGVDEQRAGRQPDELAVGRGVAAAGVVLADVARALAIVAEQRVDERGLAHARGAEHDGRPARGQVVVGEGGTPSPVSAEMSPDLDARARRPRRRRADRRGRRPRRPC